MTKSLPKQCRFCGKDFVPDKRHAKTQRYCSLNCRQTHYYRRRVAGLVEKADRASKQCEWCDKTFEPHRTQNRKQRFCSKTCGDAAFRASYVMRDSKAATKATNGAAAELFVCADLLWKGYEVFRAQSPHCSCDLIAMRDEQPLRVEVKIGYYNGKGEVAGMAIAHDRYDVLAVALPDNTVQYRRDGEEWIP